MPYAITDDRRQTTTDPRRSPVEVFDPAARDATSGGRAIASVVAALCTFTDELGDLQRRHEDDAVVGDRLGQLIEQATDTVDHLLELSAERRRASLAASYAAHPAGSALTAREATFVTWATSAEHPEHVEHDGRTVPVRQLLHDVLDSRRRLPDGAARALGVPEGTVTGCVAAWLIAAVDDPLGPRCRSLRSAVYYVRGRVDDATLVH